MSNTDNNEALADKTLAEIVASLFGGDGLCWATDDGDHLEDVCARFGAEFLDRGDDTRYHFPDGSALVTSPTGWDLGFEGEEYRDCFCWSGVAADYPEHDGHNAECVHAAEVA